MLQDADRIIESVILDAHRQGIPRETISRQVAAAMQRLTEPPWQVELAEQWRMLCELEAVPKEARQRAALYDQVEELVKDSPPSGAEVLNFVLAVPREAASLRLQALWSGVRLDGDMWNSLRPAKGDRGLIVAFNVDLAATDGIDPGQVRLEEDIFAKDSDPAASIEIGLAVFRLRPGFDHRTLVVREGKNLLHFVREDDGPALRQGAGQGCLVFCGRVVELPQVRPILPTGRSAPRMAEALPS